MRRRTGMRRGTMVMVLVVLGGTVGWAAMGCGKNSAGTNGADNATDDWRGRTFLSESVTVDGEAVALVEGTRISLELTDDGRLVAQAGCNILSGAVTVDAGRLRTSGMGGTEMGCDPARHEQDRWLAEFLVGAPVWVLDGDRLTLTSGAPSSGATEIVLVDRRVADPDRPVVGTRWVVDTLLRDTEAGDTEVGDGTASSLVAGTEGSAWLVIDDGSFTASSGCRDFDGRVTVAPHTLRFDQTIQTDPVCPPDLAEVDEVMQTILSGQVEYEVTAGRLRLTHPEAGVGLELHAEAGQ